MTKKLKDRLLNQKTPLVIAHRGNQALFPENTLSSLEDAAKLGVDVLEVDARLTSDDHLVVFHDETLERTTNGSGPLSQYSLKQLKDLDAGYHFSPDNGISHPFRGKKMEIPTLREVFTKFTNIPLNIDIKNPQSVAVTALVSLIEEYEREDLVIIGSFHDHQIRNFRKLKPDVLTAAGPKEIKNFLYTMKFRLTKLLRPKYNVFEVPLTVERKKRSFGLVTPKFIQKSHDKGISIMVWTVNNQKIMKKLIQNGVDGIFTDDPQLLINLSK